jgi:hypothetical protein
MNPDEAGRFNALVQEVKSLDRKVTFLLRHLGVEYRDPSPPSDEVAQLVIQGDKVGAIRLFMKKHGVDLLQAKQAVDDIAGRLGL